MERFVQLAIIFSVLSTSVDKVYSLSGWSYLGCFMDNIPGRVLPTLGYTGPANTIENCAATCEGLGFRIAGAEYGQVGEAIQLSVLF